jgi:hypothetical protein
MNARIAILTVLGALVVGAPVTRLACQETSEVGGILRASAGLAYGDGGNYFGRKLGTLSVAMDFAGHHAITSGPVLGFGFSYNRGLAHTVVSPLTGEIICIASPCVQPVAPRTAFPDITVGFVDIGWQKVSADYRFDARLQPGVVFRERPDIVPVSLGAGFSVARRLSSVLGLEVGTSGTYIPSYDGSRIGLRQLTIGLRSW